MNNYLNDDNILIMSWNSSVNIAYKINGKIIISPFNLNILNNIEKKYGLLIGDKPIPTTNLKVLTHENNENNIFNYIG